jgi:hypothetical protein
MALQIGKIILESNEPTRLYHFLSFIFDVEADDKDGDKIYFEAENMRFLIIKTTQKIDSKTSFVIQVDHKEEVEQLLQSVEFYYYKEGLGCAGIERNDNYASFNDPDNRSWSVEIPLFKGVSGLMSENVSNLSTNVRIC